MDSVSCLFNLKETHVTLPEIHTAAVMEMNTRHSIFIGAFLFLSLLSFN